MDCSFAGQSVALAATPLRIQALIAQDPDRVIILMDGGGRMVARHGLQPELAGVADQ
jgi:hypothetical protein